MNQSTRPESLPLESQIRANFHVSHDIKMHRGLVYCAKCGSIRGNASNKLVNLRKPCVAPTHYGARNLKDISEGYPPRHYKGVWPDDLIPPKPFAPAPPSVQEDSEYQSAAASHMSWFKKQQRESQLQRFVRSGSTGAVKQIASPAPSALSSATSSSPSHHPPAQVTSVRPSYLADSDDDGDSD